VKHEEMLGCCKEKINAMARIYPPTIILGGGFVGLFTALHLRQQNYSRPIILIEQRDRFTFKPLLYELLTGELHPEQVCPRYSVSK
jgi:NADH dehydrogenase